MERWVKVEVVRQIMAIPMVSVAVMMEVLFFLKAAVLLSKRLWDSNCEIESLHRPQW